MIRAALAKELRDLSREIEPVTAAALLEDVERYVRTAPEGPQVLVAFMGGLGKLLVTLDTDLGFSRIGEAADAAMKALEATETAQA